MQPLDFKGYAELSQPEAEAARQALAVSIYSAYQNMSTADYNDAFARVGVVPGPTPSEPE